MGNKIDSCDSLDFNKFTTCAHVPGRLESSETRSISCNESVQGRFVTIYMTRKEVLTLCEVEVYGTIVTG